MSSNATTAPPHNGGGSKNERVSEAALQFLIREIMFYDGPPEKEATERSVLDGATMLVAKTQRIENIGFDIGYRLAEKLTMDQKFLSFAELDMIKFICKDFWDEIFRKKIDKLQTNKKGVFFLFDNSFRWLEKHASNDEATREAAATLLHLPCGIVRGALANLGMTVVVNADFVNLPSVTFHIKKT